MSFSKNFHFYIAFRLLSKISKGIIYLSRGYINELKYVRKFKNIYPYLSYLHHTIFIIRLKNWHQIEPNDLDLSSITFDQSCHRSVPRFTPSNFSDAFREKRKKEKKKKKKKERKMKEEEEEEEEEVGSVRNEQYLRYEETSLFDPASRRSLTVHSRGHGKNSKVSWRFLQSCTEIEFTVFPGLVRP